MIFAIQRYLEDYFSATRRADRDQYAISLANLYDRERLSRSKEQFLSRMHAMRTAFFRANGLDRGEIEREILSRLDGRFKKTLHANPGPAILAAFESAVDSERNRIGRAERYTIRFILEHYRNAVECDAVPMFWESRKRGALVNRPEKIVQGTLALFARTIRPHRPPLTFQEFATGIGWVDMGIVISSVLHIVELKVLVKGRLVGPEQLDDYLRLKRRREGWLVVADARPPERRQELPTEVMLSGGRVAHVVRVDINPVPPSRRN